MQGKSLLIGFIIGFIIGALIIGNYLTARYDAQINELREDWNAVISEVSNLQYKIAKAQMRTGETDVETLMQLLDEFFNNVAKISMP